MNKNKDSELLQSVAKTVLALGALITGDSYVLISGEKIRKKSFGLLYRRLNALACEMGIDKTDPVEKILDKVIEILNQNNNRSGARLIEQLKEKELRDGKNKY